MWSEKDEGHYGFARYMMFLAIQNKRHENPFL